MLLVCEAWNVNFKTLHLLCKVCLLAYIWGMFLSCSDHGQPPFDKPSVTDSQRHLSLQHTAGWELHPTLTWRLQLYRLAPHKCSSLCVQSCQNVCVSTYYIQYLLSLLSLCPLRSHMVHKKLITVFECLLVCVCVCETLFVCHFFRLCSCQTDSLGCAK